MATTRVSLANIEVVENGRQIKIGSGTLFLIQKYIADGFGGQIPSTRSWEVITLATSLFELPAARQGEAVLFRSGKYEGQCFVSSDSTLKGTGPLKGW